MINFEEDVEIYKLLAKAIPENMGLKLLLHTKNYTGRFGERYSLEYVNNLEIKLTINYIAGNAKLPQHFSAYIDKDGKTLSVQDYCKQNNLCDVDNIFYDISKSDNFKSEFIIFLKNIFETSLKKVLEGKEWIDIPFDWHGYK